MITKFNLFENVQEDEYENYAFLGEDDESELRDLLYDDILDDVMATTTYTFDELKLGNFDYNRLKPWGVSDLQAEAKEFLDKKNVDYTIPEMINTLNKIINEISDENDVDWIFDNIIIDYYKKHKDIFFADKDYYDFTDKVITRLNRQLDFNL